MVVTTAITGASSRNERSLSSASTTMYSPWPTRALAPAWFTRPPTTNVGSRPAAARTAATIEVVVVFPCAPATAMPNFRRISSASISARGITGIFSRCASTTSTLSCGTAEEITTTCAPCTLFGADGLRKSWRPSCAAARLPGRVSNRSPKQRSRSRAALRRCRSCRCRRCPPDECA